MNLRRGLLWRSKTIEVRSLSNRTLLGNASNARKQFEQQPGSYLVVRVFAW